ncbi:MAG: polyprenyl diphosphate synthase [Candidatus Nealsonbacteria bacterium]
MIENLHHLGIIMDGNRRWAREKGQLVFRGHVQGLETLKKIVRHCNKKGVEKLTIFAFSTENWNRPKKEVDFLMNLIKRALNKDLKELDKENIKIRIIGQREKLPKKILLAVNNLENLTKNNTGMTLNIALSYGGRAEITSAIKSIIRKKISPDKITEQVISDNLWTSDLDFLIRTGKEQRISNFLIWQSAYSELYFSSKHWPDFNENDLDEALHEFSLRKRRKGK